MWQRNNISLATQQSQAFNDKRLDWPITAMVSWLFAGLYADGWAHGHLARLETFFTPWHALLYSGFLATAGVLIAIALRRRKLNGTWQHALPQGYQMSLVGVVIFGIGGICDMLWHIFFGIETDIAALLSPTHLMLATGIFLIVGGPFRAAWHRTTKKITLLSFLPALLSLTFILSLLNFFTEFSHPFVLFWAAPSPQRVQTYGFLAMSTLGPAIGITGIELQSGIFMAIVLLMVRRWQLPFGGLTIIFTFNTALLAILNDHYKLIPSGILTGFLADFLYKRLKPSPQHQEELRIFAFSVPFLWMALYFLNLLLTGEKIQWSIHLWMGSIIIAGIVGLLLSYVVMPMPYADEE